MLLQKKRRDLLARARFSEVSDASGGHLNPNTAPLLFNLIKSCHDMTRLYPDGNPRMEEHLGHFVTAYKEFLDIDGQMEIRVVGPVLQINDEMLSKKAMEVAGPAWFLLAAKDRGIESLTLKAGLRVGEVRALIDLFVLERHKLREPGSVSAFLKNRHVEGVIVNGEDDELVDMDLEPISEESTFSDPSSTPMTVPPVAPAGFRQPETTATTSLFIDEADRRAIHDAMANFIRVGNLRGVAETLTMIRKDLGAEFREDREIAFSSYQEVIRVLIETDQESSLKTVLPTIREDLEACHEEDLARVHLQTLTLMIRYFSQLPRRDGYLRALDLLANRVLVGAPDISRAAEEIVSELLEPGEIGKLLRIQEPALGPIKKSLFKQHGTALLRPLLKTLFESEDRALRKLVLESLHLLGPIIYPALLVELQQAIENGRPWYVKRNLVTLLSIKPPVDMVPMIVDLIKEDNPKMRDLLHRCLFQIPDQQAYTVGRAILRAADESKLPKLLRYLHVSRDPSYGRAIREIYAQVTSDAIKMDIIDILGRLASKECLAFLEGILSRGGRGGEPRERRLAAVRALAASKKAEGMELLFKHQKDGDKEVRAAIQGAIDTI